jgi:hypothetical protein
MVIVIVEVVRLMMKSLLIMIMVTVVVIVLVVKVMMVAVLVVLVMMMMMIIITQYDNHSFAYNIYTVGGGMILEGHLNNSINLNKFSYNMFISSLNCISAIKKAPTIIDLKISM